MDYGLALLFPKGKEVAYYGGYACGSRSPDSKHILSLHRSDVVYLGFPIIGPPSFDTVLLDDHEHTRMTLFSYRKCVSCNPRTIPSSVLFVACATLEVSISDCIPRVFPLLQPPATGISRGQFSGVVSCQMSRKLH